MGAAAGRKRGGGGPPRKEAGKGAEEEGIEMTELAGDEAGLRRAQDVAEAWLEAIAKEEVRDL